MKTYNNNFISQFIEKEVDFDDIRWGYAYPVDEDTVLYMYNFGSYYKVQVCDLTMDYGFIAAVIGEQVNIGTGDFEDDLYDCIYGALRDANKTRREAA